MSLLCRVLSTAKVIRSGFNPNSIEKVLFPLSYNCNCKVNTETFDSKFLTILRKYGTASEKDKNSEERELIYTGLLRNKIRRIKLFSLTTSILGIGAQPFVYMNAVSTGSPDALFPVFTLIGMFAVATPLMLHLCLKNYVIEVYYLRERDSYLATFYNIFCRKQEIEFTPDDVSIPAVLGMFANCSIYGKTAYLDSQSFTDQQHYVRIMGYDKPMDFKLETESQERISKNKEK